MNITSKYRSLSVQAKAALWFTICSFLQKGISFITVPIFTRLMSTEEYGTYTVYLSWLQILTIMTSLYLFNGVYDNAMAKYEKQRASVKEHNGNIWIGCSDCAEQLHLILRKGKLSTGGRLAGLEVMLSKT